MHSPREIRTILPQVSNRDKDPWLKSLPHFDGLDLTSSPCAKAPACWRQRREHPFDPRTISGRRQHLVSTWASSPWFRLINKQIIKCKITITLGPPYTERGQSDKFITNCKFLCMCNICYQQSCYFKAALSNLVSHVATGNLNVATSTKSLILQSWHWQSLLLKTMCMPKGPIRMTDFY